MTEDYDNEALSVRDEEHMSTDISLIPAYGWMFCDPAKPSDEEPMPDPAPPHRATEDDNNPHADCESSKFKPGLQANPSCMEVSSEDR
jgi:hypothetical protein